MDTFRVDIVDPNNNEHRQVTVSGGLITIGRSESSTIVLNGIYVSRLHAILHLKPSKCELECMTPNSTYCRVDNEPLEAGHKVKIDHTSSIQIAQYSLHVVRIAADGPSELEWERLGLDAIGTVHAELVERFKKGESLPTKEDTKFVVSEIEQIATNTIAEQDPETMESVTTLALFMRMVDLRDGAAHSPGRGSRPVAGHETEITERLRALMSRHDGLFEATRLEALKARLSSELLRMAADLDDVVRNYVVHKFLVDEVYDAVLGFGPLERYLRRRDITEVMVVGQDQIYVESKGRIERTGQKFATTEILLNVITRMIDPLGRHINRAHPMVDGRLPNGDRVNAVIEPIAVNGPHLTVRKFRDDPFTIDDLIEFGSLDARAASFLRACVLGRRSILVAGGTGSGKTTLLNVLGGYIPSTERIVTVEDSAELRLPQEHVATMESRPANVDGKGQISIRDMVINALRMRPDRIIVGECRGAETIDMLQAMNTGHAGSMTTLHANSAQDAVVRLESMVLAVADMPLPAIRTQIANAIDMIVYMDRRPGGGRQLMQITEVVEIDPDTEEIVTADIMRRDPAAGVMELRPTGRLPSFAPYLVRSGFLKTEELFGE